MKNPNKVRTYWGYTFIFEDELMMYKFVELYRDLFVSYETGKYNNTNWLAIRVGKGVISEIKKGLGDSVVTKHKRYYVKGIAA